MLLFISSVHSFAFVYPIPDITGRLEFISDVTDRKAGCTRDISYGRTNTDDSH